MINKSLIIKNIFAARCTLHAARYALQRAAIFVFCILLLCFTSNIYALNLDNLKMQLLTRDYKAAILEGEKILASAGTAKDADELYYILGLSYLKDGNYLRASDIFEIILREFKNSAFRDEAKLGLGDTYFLRGDFINAQDCYKELINRDPATKLKAQVYYRLSQVGFKKGDTQQGKEYLEKLKQGFPLNPEELANKDLFPLQDFSADIYYTVQVGAFLNINNAKNLTQSLIQKNYPAYIEEADSQGAKSYRVRVGKFRLLQEARELEDKLIKEGYPTKICP